MESFSARVFRVCVKQATPVALENPATSLLWQVPQYVSLARSEEVKCMEADYCLYGMPWRERTRFMYARFDLTPAACRCSSRKGMCDRTGKRHVQLRGAQGGKLLTKLAEPYPAPLSRLLARCFSAALCVQKTHRMRHITSTSLRCLAPPAVGLGFVISAACGQAKSFGSSGLLTTAVCFWLGLVQLKRGSCFVACASVVLEPLLDI